MLDNSKIRSYIPTYLYIHTYIHAYMHSFMHTCTHMHTGRQTDRQFDGTDRQIHVVWWGSDVTILIFSPTETGLKGTEGREYLTSLWYSL